MREWFRTEIRKIRRKRRKILCWHMNFDLAYKSDDMKRLVWEFTIDYKEAKSYRKEREGMLRQNQWHDLTVKVFM